ncbi:MAG: rhodanese-like domain-containing protein [Flavobacteriaceae bacterium]|nr:rhodanese-like domain-containing protein [Flavobacteriaceae bacterium]
MFDIDKEAWADGIKKDKDVVILDVRTQEEIEEGYIPGALHNDIYQRQSFLDKLEPLDRDKNYYVYCRSGNRSEQACAVMHSLGFKHTYNLPGGIIEWQGETHK